MGWEGSVMMPRKGEVISQPIVLILLGKNNCWEASFSLYITSMKLRACNYNLDLRNSREFLDAPTSFTRSRPPSDDEESAKALLSSLPLSSLLIPSLKEVSDVGLNLCSWLWSFGNFCVLFLFFGLNNSCIHSESPEKIRVFGVTRTTVLIEAHVQFLGQMILREPKNDIHYKVLPWLYESIVP